MMAIAMIVACMTTVRSSQNGHIHRYTDLDARTHKAMINRTVRTAGLERMLVVPLVCSRRQWREDACEKTGVRMCSHACACAYDYPQGPFLMPCSFWRFLICFTPHCYCFGSHYVCDSRSRSRCRSRCRRAVLAVPAAVACGASGRRSASAECSTAAGMAAAVPRRRMQAATRHCWLCNAF